MRTLKSRWAHDTRPDVRGEWWLTIRENEPNSNRAYIQAKAGQWVLYVWDRHPTHGLYWVEHAKGKDLRTLKAIGRLVAARLLNENF